MATKTCTQCGETKPLDEFYVLGKSRTADGHSFDCKVCNRTRARDHNRRRRLDDPIGTVDRRMRAVYGIGLADYEEILARQGSGCAACGALKPGGRGQRFHIDHDHGCCPGGRSCGRCVRGLLCHGCNVGIGSLGDDPNRLLAAAAYLLATRDVLAEGAMT